MSELDRASVPTTAKEEPRNQFESQETPAAQSENAINPTENVPATVTEPCDRQERNEEPTDQPASDSTNKLDLAGCNITFKNLDLGDYAPFENCLLDCGYQVAAGVSGWRHSILPIVEDIRLLATRASEKLRAHESQFGPDWDEADPEQELLHSEAVTFNNLLRQLLNIYGFGEDLADYFYRLWAKIRDEARAARYNVGDYKPLVDREAWKCLMWYWWGFRVYFKSPTDEVRPILEGWDTWDWPDLRTKKDALKLVAFLVGRRVRNLPREEVLEASEWRDLLVQENSDAFDWLEHAD